MGTYVCKIYTKKEDMYKTYEVAKVLNPGMTKEEYRQTIDDATYNTNYTQFVMLKRVKTAEGKKEPKPVAFICVQDVLVMKHAPKRCGNVSNIACLPEYQGNGLMEVFMKQVAEHYARHGYVNLTWKSGKNSERSEAFYRRKTGAEKEKNFAWTLDVTKFHDVENDEFDSSKTSIKFGSNRDNGKKKNTFLWVENVQEERKSNVIKAKL
ncbi:MAG: hypothetical protein K0R98_1518 [Rickettsiaceae bacterium]|jgi:hypothetical protein|nr:hypothetical protein [Rickettsiaceae bacterium]